MFVFIKQYWLYLLKIIGGSILSITNFSDGDNWLGFVWLFLAVYWTDRLYQRHQRDKKSQT